MAADRVILGKLLIVEEAAGGMERRIRAVGKESDTDLPVLSDPRTGGATLTLIANGGTDSHQDFVLDASGWRTRGAGYQYDGPTGADGDPVKTVVLKRTTGGRAAIKIVLSSSVGTQPLDVVPPAPGTTGGAALAVAGGDRYCVQLGGAAGGTVTSDTTQRWRIRSATAEAGCPVAETTCGDGVSEGDELCDGDDLGLCPTFDCFPAGHPDACHCCIPPDSTGPILFGQSQICCDGRAPEPIGPGFVYCPGTFTCGGVSEFPTCAGTCPGGTSCVAIVVAGPACVCLPPGPCDTTCTGAECPAGQACDTETCSCVTP
jgi:hypothetical protein